jgi:hypothetical protein
MKKMRTNILAKYVQHICNHNNPNISYGLYDDVKAVKIIKMSEEII